MGDNSVDQPLVPSRLKDISFLRRRVLISVAIGLAAALFIGKQYGDKPNFHTDFGMSWFGAKSVLHGADPYPLVGPGRQFNYGWPLTYPATSFIALSPLGFVNEKTAAMIFVGLSSALLCFGLTRDGFYLLPLFLTEAYLNGARLGQWNIALTAILFFPWLAALAAVKPQAALPPIIGSAKKESFAWAALGGSALFFASLLLIPGWPREWLTAMKSMPPVVHPPITWPFGFLIPLVLFRWKRKEAWLVMAMAVVPQTSAWYSTLPLFTVPRTLAQSVTLVSIATIGGVLGAEFVPDLKSYAELERYVNALHIFTMYLPAVILVLRRKNETGVF
jgi:hypothetical protein